MLVLIIVYTTSQLTKSFSIFRARTSNKVLHECILWKSVPDKSVSKVDLQGGKKKKKVLEEKIWSTHLTTLVNIDIQKLLS